MELILIRHGRPEKEIRTDGGYADPPLSPIGLKQAEAVSLALAVDTVDVVVASPMNRAAQTAEPTALRLGVNIVHEHRIKEVDHTSNEYTPGEEIDRERVKEMLANPMALFDAVGGYPAFRDTVVDAFDDMVAANKGKTVAVFCHSGVIGTYTSTLLGLDTPFNLGCDYCGLTRITAASNGLRTIRTVNEISHLRDLL